MLRRGKETAAVAVNNLVQSLSLVGVLFFYFTDAPASASDLQQQVCKGREGKGREGGVAEVKPNRRVRTSGGRIFRERGERKLLFVQEYSYSRTTIMSDEWDFQRIRRFMDEQAAMPASSVLCLNAADLIRQLQAAPRGTYSTMAAETAGTNSRLKAPAAVELQPVQQSPSITSYMEALQAASGMQPSRNRSCEVPATDQSKLIFQQTVRTPTFTELVVQASSCVEEIRHDLQHDVAIIPPKHAPKRYKTSSCAEKLLNHQTLTPALREADQAHAIPSKRSGKAVYRKQLQQPQTDHEEPNLELRLGNGHLHNVDVQRRTFLHSRAKELQLQRAAAAAAAAAYPISCHIPIEAPRPSPNEFQYRVESRAGMLQQGASAFSKPAAAAPPPIIGSTVTMLPVSTTPAAHEDLRLGEPHSGAAKLEALKDDARAAALRSYRRRLMTRSASSSSEMPNVLPLVPYTTITATESYKGPPHQNCSAATTTIRNATLLGHPRSAVMGTMGPHPQMMSSAMGPPPVPAIMGPTASLPSSVISTPFPLGRPLPSLPGDLSLSPPHAGQQEEVANCAALVQIPGRSRSRNAPAVAAATTAVVVGKVPDFWVTLTKFAVDCKFSVDWSDAENHNQQRQVQLVLPEVISKHLPKEAVTLILRAKVAVDGHNNSAFSSSSSSHSGVGAGAVAQHHHQEPLDWPVVWRPTAWISSICDGWSHFVKDGKLAVGDFCRFHQNSLDKNLFEVEITRPITL